MPIPCVVVCHCFGWGAHFQLAGGWEPWREFACGLGSAGGRGGAVTQGVSCRGGTGKVSLNPRIISRVSIVEGGKGVGMYR